MGLGYLITPVDFVFALSGITITLGMLLRRSKQREKFSSSASLPELVTALIALACTAVGPNILVVALTPGMPSMPILTKYILSPSVTILILLLGISKRMGWVHLSNRIWTGIWAGAAATGVLDAVRLTGFSLGLMPGNMPRMFGVLILDTMAKGPSLASDLIGYLYHYWVGACFGLTLTLVFGKTRWWAGLVWGVIIEIGMMTTPPMVVAMDTGYFGLKHGPGLLLVSFLAHIAYGTFLGLLVQKYVSRRGNLVRQLYEFFKKNKLQRGGPSNEGKKEKTGDLFCGCQDPDEK